MRRRSNDFCPFEHVKSILLLARRGDDDVRDGEEDDLDKFQANGLFDMLAPQFYAFNWILTSSDDAACKSTALLKSSSRTEKTPSPSSNKPWRQAKNRSTSLKPRQFPASSFSCATWRASSKTSLTKSGLVSLRYRITAAVKGILKGCSPTLGAGQSCS